jgi:hypothetical protein
MGYSVSERVIKLLCGKPVYEEGALLFHSGKVELTWQEETSEPGGHLSRTDYEAIVHGRGSCDVKAAVDSDGDVRAECTCPAYAHGGPFCKHIAAVLIHLDELAHGAGGNHPTAVSSLYPQQTTGIADGVLTPRNFTGSAVQDSQLVSSMLGMFGNTRPRPSGAGTYVDTRATLSVEWVLKPFSYNYGSMMLGMEMKIGRSDCISCSESGLFWTP